MMTMMVVTMMDVAMEGGGDWEGVVGVCGGYGASAAREWWGSVDRVIGEGFWELSEKLAGKVSPGATMSMCPESGPVVLLEILEIKEEYVNKVQVMGTLDGRLLKSYRYKDLRALHFGILLCCEIFTFQVEQFKPMGFLMPPEHHIPLRPILRVLQIGIRAKVIENQGIPIVNAGELPEMDSYEEVAQQGKAPPLSPAYVPDPIELDEHVPLYVPEPEHPEYHVPSIDDIQVKDQPYVDDASPTTELPGYIADSDSMEEDSIDYPYEPEDDDDDPEEDDDEDPEEDPSEEHEPEDDTLECFCYCKYLLKNHSQPFIKLT
ncbi:hypothetical protein Tco_0285028 [Tanacetum coccineum]